MTIYYLYVKTHKITGLKYLGKTSQDPFEYLGSGRDWILHIAQYGIDINTEILKECSTPQELSYWGRYYSRLFKIVGAMDDYGNKIWANRIPETGGGPGQIKGSSKSIECRIKISENHIDVSGANNPMYGKKHSQETKQKIANRKKGKLIGEGNPMFNKSHSSASKKLIGEASKLRWQDPVWKAKWLAAKTSSGRGY
jgi:hypothetical protein